MVWEGIALGVVLIGAGAAIFRGMRRRTAFSRATASELLPLLPVQTRVTGKLRRVFRDDDTPLAELAMGKRLLIFCTADHNTRADDWRLKTAQDLDIALYGMATLEPGGADTIKHQIKDADQVEITPDILRFMPVSAQLAGQQKNDYFAIGRILSHRDETWDDEPLTIYRLQSAPDLTLEVATPRTTVPFAEGQMVHGTVRLFGYLAGS